MAQNEKVPDDWCYIYNFEKPNEPVAVNLQAGKGKEFKQDIDELVDLFKTEIPKVFESEEYEKGKAEKIREYQKKRAELLEKLNNNAEEKGFKVKTSGAGIFFLPIIEGRNSVRMNTKSLTLMQKRHKRKVKGVAERNHRYYQAGQGNRPGRRK